MSKETPNQDHGQPKARKERFWSNPFFWAFVSGVAVVTAMRPYLVRHPEPPPVMSGLPSYALTNQEGVTFGSRDLKGQVYVASFIFTQCQSTCPMITRAMSALQKRFSDAQIPVKLVSFSVDPDNDAPAVLKTYAQKYEADFSRWSFLTGKHEDLRSLLEGGFKVPLGDKVTAPGNLFDIAHTQKVVIVDREGGIRGYYESSETGMDEVFHRAQHVLGERIVTK